MHVKLLAHTPDPEKVIATAAKLCYSDSDVESLYDGLTPEKTEKFLDMLTSIGHESPIEHVSFTFGIEGISRSCSHQLVRHRIASFSQKSQRYVCEGQFEFITPPAIEADPDLNALFFEHTMMTQQVYEKLRDGLIANHTERIMLEDGVSEDVAKKKAEKLANEDARFVLPNACETKIIVTMNVRSLFNFFRHRCCCFSDDTEVLTNHGWKLFSDCTDDDLFYSLDLTTGNAELVKAEQFISYPVDEDLVRVKAQFIDQLITKDHNVVVSTSYEYKRWRLMPVEEAMQHKQVLMKRNANPIQGVKPTTFRIPAVRVNKHNQYSAWDLIHPERDVPIADFLKFLGFYISDGCIVNSGQHYMIYLAKGNMDVILKYKSICERLTTHKVSIIQDSAHCWKLAFHDRNLYDLLKPLGKAIDKYIPEFVWKLDHTLLAHLYEGLCDGDMKADGSVYGTISKRLADDIQRLLLHLGVSGSIFVVDRVGKPGGRVLDRKGNIRSITHKHPEYRITVNRKKNEPIIKAGDHNAFSFEHYKGMVYCVDLSKNHTLYVRRNGFVSWSGNCRAQWELRAVADEMLRQCKEVAPHLFANAGPSCVMQGKCPERKMTCGKFNEVMRKYKSES